MKDVYMNGVFNLNFEEAVSFIQAQRGSKFGLERIIDLCKALGNPQKKLKFIHVAGTNGKGSTVTMLAKTLINAGYRTGVFMSPYLQCFEEQISINGNYIPQSQVIELTESIKQLLQNTAADDLPSEFEITTAMAFEYFHRNNCDVVVLECGLGGRLDSTNVIPKPLCSVITKISLDHTDYLGNTIAQIAKEKAGIIKESGIVVSYAGQEPEVMEILKENAKAKDSQFVSPELQSLEILSSDLTGSVFKYQGEEFNIRLVGPHQCENALTVIETIKTLIKMGYEITQENLLEALKEATVPARLEVLSSNPTVILDAAHNADGVMALANSVDKLLAGRPLITVMGMLGDKDYPYCVSQLAKRSDALYTVTPNNPRALDAQILAEYAKKDCHNVASYTDYKEALTSAITSAGPTGTVLICGSIYMAGNMRNILQNVLTNPR